jgi:hypothetical protein
LAIFHVEILPFFYLQGITVMTPQGEPVGESKKAATEGISKVVLSRIGMAGPGMVAIPIIMNSLDKRGVIKKYPRLNAPLQIGLCGLILTFATPLCCAIFEQMSSIPVDRVEDPIQERMRRTHPAVQYLVYNKGL